MNCKPPRELNNINIDDYIDAILGYGLDFEFVKSELNRLSQMIGSDVSITSVSYSGTFNYFTDSGDIERGINGFKGKLDYKYYNQVSHDFSYGSFLCK